MDYISIAEFTGKNGVPSDIASGIKQSAGGYFCRDQCPVVGVGLVCGFICVRYRYFDGFPVLSADRVE